jgi:hypothetical protein
LGAVGGDEAVEKVDAAVIVDDAFEIVGVVDEGALGVELDKPVRCGDGLFGLVGLVIGVGHVQLGLHGVTAEGVARLQLLVVFDGRFITARVQFRGCLGIELGRAPVLGDVFLLTEKGAARQEQGQ